LKKNKIQLRIISLENFNQTLETLVLFLSLFSIAIQTDILEIHKKRVVLI